MDSFNLCIDVSSSSGVVCPFFSAAVASVRGLLARRHRLLSIALTQDLAHRVCHDLRQVAAETPQLHPQALQFCVEPIETGVVPV
jgi:hypothetical protein